jgi:hypothetical protein
MGDYDWGEIYDDDKVAPDPVTALHQLNHGILEDAYNKVCSVFVLLLLLLLLFRISKLHPSSVISAYVAVTSYS